MTRTPAEIRSTRIGALARLPVFFALEDKRAVVAGGSPAAAWKAELLSAAGARVEVFAAAPSEEMLALAADAAARRGRRSCASLERRTISPAPQSPSPIVTDDDEAAAFAAAARAAGVPVNVIDRPAFCDFSFGAIVNRSPLVIGISTDGAAPVFGQAIRAKLEALIPQGLCALGRRRPRAGARRCRRPALPFGGRRVSGSFHRPRGRSTRTQRRPMPTSMRCSPADATAPPTPARSLWSAPAPAIRNC